MLNELDKTLARMGAYIMALEQTLARVQQEQKDTLDAHKKVHGGIEPQHGPVSGQASD